MLSLVIDNAAQRNALQPAISAAAARELRLAAHDDGVGAIVLSGAGEHFCAGGDLRTLNESRRANPPQVHVERIGALNELVRSLRACPKPVIAAVEGNAAGAGFSVALACDLIVAAEDARFTLSYVKVGLNPDGGGSYFLSRALPRQLAAEIALTGGPVPAARLASSGLVNRLVARGRALTEALEWAAQLASGPMRALGRIKRLLDEATTQGLHAHLELERALFVEALHGDEAAEGIAAFLEKRGARFQS